MMANLLGALAHPFWFATPENEWQQLFWKYIPSWLTNSDTETLREYFAGGSTFHKLSHVRAWFVPVLAWSGFIFALYFSLLCISSILRKQWMDDERLSYPIVQLPLAMTMSRKFFSSKLMWIGFAVAASVRTLNILHDLIPGIPQMPYNYRLDHFFTERPWNAIGYTSMSFNLALVGLTYFMPLDLSFSCWFFFWLTRAERVFASVVGWKSLYLNERASGAWMGICVLSLWVSRRHLLAFVKHVFGHTRMDDSRELMRHRTTALLLLLSFAGSFLFCYFAGMSAWAILVFYGLFYMLAIAFGRVRAELGPPYHEVVFINPRQMMVQMFGARRLGGKNLTVLAFLYAFNRSNRSHPMPIMMESLKIGNSAGMKNRRLVQAIVLAIGAGAVSTFWSYLQVAYKYGTVARCRGWLGRSGWEAFNPLYGWLQYPQGTDVRSLIFMSGGLGFVVLLYVMRTRFLWWPLHPSGYVLSGASWGGMIYFWFPVMLSWLAKSIILKHGGRGAHRKAVPFFLGLVLGNYIPRSISSIVSLVFDIFMPSAGVGSLL